MYFFVYLFILSCSKAIYVCFEMVGVGEMYVNDTEFRVGMERVRGWGEYVRLDHKLFSG